MLLANQTAGFFTFKIVNDEVYFWHADKHWSFVQIDTIILVIGMPKVPKKKNPKKHGE